MIRKKLAPRMGHRNTEATEKTKKDSVHSVLQWLRKWSGWKKKPNLLFHPL